MAIIRENQLDAVIERLVAIGEPDFTITAARGAGRGARRRHVFRGNVYIEVLSPKILIEWHGPDMRADAVVRAIRTRAATGRVGDGRIFVHSVEEPARPDPNASTRVERKAVVT